ncbi:MAG: neutral/alkaline non-lysosomal ceramidase N-terminal domain-containing protein [Spirosomataceae bacterium]
MSKLKWSAFGLAILVVLILLAVFAFYNGRDRHSGYSLFLNRKAPKDTVAYSAGFAALKITPQDWEKWNDKNSDAAFNKEDGDTYEDKNGNEKFDTYWLAGFGKKRATTGIHDDLWARTMVLDNGHTRIAIVAIDLIGFPHTNVINVRKKLAERFGLTYIIICSTHNHEAPDMLGLWGDSFLKSGVNPIYEKWVENRIVESIEMAVKNLKQAHLRVAQDLTGAESLNIDTRKPVVKDNGVYILQATDAKSGTALGAFVVWGNHPETLWSKNTLITSDFPHYVREGIEKGLYSDKKLVKKGLGGIVLYASGCVGGLMTTRPSVKIKDPFKDIYYEGATFEKAQAQGNTLALLALNALEKSEPVKGGINLFAKTFELPLGNILFRLGIALGVIDWGYSSWGHLRTEAAALSIGNVSLITVPGELYPEIANGGIETPKEGDFKLIHPIETPSLRSLMPGKYKFVLGLANDELGYIIPKSEWDKEAPYLYGSPKAHYGEVNSTGPATAPILHKTLKEMLEKLPK